ncbi:MAG: alpha/beta hydrolase [Rhodospirillaceae bacterium]|nr:alpha/beta hydrolase [Rhodospirillaceae bacterium]
MESRRFEVEPGRSLAYTHWGDPANPRTLICVHGLTRNGRDFDHLARAVEADYRIVCPDVAGRGDSDWLEDKDAYGFDLYCRDVLALIGHLGVGTLDWLGTSMGGIIGMMLAARPDGPVGRLILNDVGAFIPAVALERIAGYVGGDPAFIDRDEAEARFREVLAPFGPLTDAQWDHMVEHGVEERGGALRLRYDPAIARPFESGEIVDVDLWPLWDAVACPVLVLRGSESDLLRAETVAEMKTRGPGAALGVESVEIPSTGHAPTLMDPAQIAAVRDWLLWS